MPTFENKTPSSYWKRWFQIDQSINRGIDATVRNIQTGEGTNTPLALSYDKFQVKPINNNTTETLACKQKDGDNVLSVDTTNDRVLIGTAEINALTLTKDMGLYDFSPTAGYHHPLIANNMMFSDSGSDIEADTSMFSNADDPAASLDLSADGDPKVAVACYWYLENNITLDTVRYTATTDGSDTLKFHIWAYTLDTTTNLGDLSGGLLHAHNHDVTSTATTLSTSILTLDTANIDAGKVVIGFVESDATSDITCSLNIKYHYR